MKKTSVLRVNPKRPEIKKINEAADFIKEGGLVAFPTETVYGLGADAFNSRAVRRLFEAKKRPLDNPPIVHIAKIQDISKLAENIPPKTEVLTKNFWPGPLTLIFNRSEILPDVTVAGLETLAVRMPDHNVALALIRESECPIAAPSANLSGKPSPTTVRHVLDDLDGRIDAILDAGSTTIGVESTVLDMTVTPPQILRPGGTPYELLTKVLGRVELHPAAVAKEALKLEETRSPGLKHRHYSPEAEVIVVEGNVLAMIDKVRRLVNIYKRKNLKVGVLAADETATKYEADVVKSFGKREELTVIAKNLFRLLREFDLEGVDVIIAESVPTSGLGLAVMNRLHKASGYKIVKASDN